MYPKIIAEVGCNHKGSIDIAEEMIKTASKYCNVFNGDLSKFKENNFNIITALHIIEHHKNPEKFIKMIYKKLKKKRRFNS